MIYLSSPYSHPSPAVREQRFEAACKATAALLKAGKLVFSPIVHSHHLERFGCPNTHEFWMPIDEAYLKLCRSVYVLTIDGWQDSRGVLAELDMAHRFDKIVHYMKPPEES